VRRRRASRCRHRRRQAATNVALSRCRQRLAAAKLPPSSRFRAAAKQPLTSRCRAAATAASTAAEPPFVGWLLHCFPPSDFGHATINAHVAGRFCQ
jgi:predicted TIM-barrel fold metal-dependent hydrolase